MPDILSAEVRAHRARLDMTQTECADSFGCSIRSWARLEDGDRSGGLEAVVIRQLAEWFEVPPSLVLQWALEEVDQRRRAGAGASDV